MQAKDAVIISDLHLGSKACQASAICSFLPTIRAQRLILNGDILDSLDCRRLTKPHWRVLSKIRSLSDDMEVVWIRGNHDGYAEQLSDLLGVSVLDEFAFQTGGKKCLVMHGDRFDSFIDNHPILTWAGDQVYSLLQRIDHSQCVARAAKRSSKTFMRICGAVRQGAIRRAVACGATMVCCGHTHHHEEHTNTTLGVAYANSGCWTENHCHYVSVRDGKMKVKRF
jgi:UDP-2,3-diacylglucosamine pyrophosphatase LpxH